MVKSKTPRLTPKQNLFLKEYIKNKGHIGKACDKAKISRQTYYYWVKEIPLFKERFEEEIEKYNDSIQTTILKLALKEDRDLLKFWASRKMKHRGFTEKQEIEHTGTTTTVLTTEQIHKEVKRLLNEGD